MNVRLLFLAVFILMLSVSVLADEAVGSVSVSVNADSIKPFIIIIEPLNGTNVTRGSSVNARVNITDNIAVNNANITFYAPNHGIYTLTLNLVSTDIYSAAAYVAHEGRINFTVSARDSTGNTATKTGYYIVTPSLIRGEEERGGGGRGLPEEVPEAKKEPVRKEVPEPEKPIYKPEEIVPEMLPEKPEIMPPSKIIFIKFVEHIRSWIEKRKELVFLGILFIIFLLILLLQALWLLRKSRD